MCRLLLSLNGTREFSSVPFRFSGCWMAGLRWLLSTNAEVQGKFFHAKFGNKVLPQIGFGACGSRLHFSVSVFERLSSSFRFPTSALWPLPPRSMLHALRHAPRSTLLG